uniref:Uncharacterized protein n=1 Tax=Avena sativa TaxID=4498 RepID=A0ACD5WQP0_AVESA
MASCGGGSGGDDGGRRSPPAVLYEDLVEVREQAARLQSMLQVSPSVAAVDAREVVSGMMARLSSAMSVLDTAGAAAASPASSGTGRGPSGRRKRPGAAAAASGPHRRSSSSRRRTKSPFIKMVTAAKLDDGKSWRKYGQKNIHDSINPRSYYRCTYKTDQGCMATRQVQKSHSDPSELEISYYGQHTCRDPATFSSFIVQGAAAATAPSDGANLISFDGDASTSTSAFPHRFVKETVDHRVPFSRFSSYSSSPAHEGPNEGAPSGSPSPACYETFMQYAGGQLADVLGRTTSPLTVGSAPAEYWPVVKIAGVDVDAAGASMDSFPSSPSSLGFMSGSLGSFGGNNLGGDDDLFDFDS